MNMGTNEGLGKFVLSSKGNSHPFTERVLFLNHEGQKVGRSVGRTKPASNNLIFDCKVLSRNHALVWYEGGQFWVQDTKSSNGTFVASTKLNKGTEDSPPKAIYHEDIIQFGVDVVENQRNGVSMTHGCIIGIVYLFHPDGSEAKPVSSNGGPNQILFSSGLPIPTQDLYQLQKYLEEASHREQLLESKLAALQRLVTDTRTCSNESWRAQVEEDSLLTRLELLESQLLVFSKNLSDDSLQKEIQMLNQDKVNYASNAKTSVEKIVKEKQEVECKLSEVERCYSETEDECEHLRNTSEETANRLHELATKHTELLEQISQLKSKLQETENSRNELSACYDVEKQALLREIEKLSTNEDELSQKVAALESQLSSFSASGAISLDDSIDQSQRVTQSDSSKQLPVITTQSGGENESSIEKTTRNENQDERVNDSFSCDKTPFKEQSIDEAIELRGLSAQAGFPTSENETRDFTAGDTASNSNRKSDIIKFNVAGDETSRISLEQFPIGELSKDGSCKDVFKALQMEIKSYSEQLEKACAKLTLETKEELICLRDGMNRTVAAVAELENAFDNKIKTIQDLETELSRVRNNMHNKENELKRVRSLLDESGHEMASKDVEIVALQEQLNSTKVNMDMLKNDATQLNCTLETCHQEKQLQLEQFTEKLRKTEAELKEVKEKLLSNRKGGAENVITEDEILRYNLKELHCETQSLSFDTNTNSGNTGPALEAASATESIEDLPANAFHRTPVKIIDKLRRTEAEKDRISSELKFVQSRLKDNQSQMSSALQTLGQSVNSLKSQSAGLSTSGSETATAKPTISQAEIDAAVAEILHWRLREVSEELCSLQSARQSLATSQSDLVSQVAAAAASNSSATGQEDSILLLQKLPLFIIILAVICAIFKLIFPD